MFNRELSKNISDLSVVVLTGAGISAESGLKTFRDNDGLWEQHSIEEVATPEAFASNPELVYRFYNQRRQQLLSGEVRPNAAHLALAMLERALGHQLTMITQNVDNLHEAAGSQRVIHMHGELVKVKCVNSGMSMVIDHDVSVADVCRCCRPGNRVRPDIVWFGEIPYEMELIEQRLSAADLFVSIGTSGNVYPAAGFVQFAKRCGAYCIELNLEPSSGSHNFDDASYGVATVTVPRFVELLLSSNC